MRRLFTIVTLSLAACGGGAPSTPFSATQPATPGTTSGDPNEAQPQGDLSPQRPSPSPSPSPPSSPSSPSSAAPGTRAHAAHSHCGWIGADTAAAGTAAFMANPDWFDAVHPKWFTLNSDGTPRSIAFTDDAQVTATARAHGVLLMPLIDADSADYLRAAMAEPAAHAQALADLATQHGYDGLELDYEHLWESADRPGFVALVAQVAAALHARGKLLSMALPAIAADDGNSAYDYAALQQSADVLHLMGYDFHWLGGPHLGPIAPLGWVSDVLTRVESLGAPAKYVLGVANYAIGDGWYTTAADAVSRCGSYSRVTDHMLTCSLGHQEAGSAPHCTTSQGDLWFEDAVSVGEKTALAKASRLGGVCYWTLGGESPGFFDAISAVYP